MYNVISHNFYYLCAKENWKMSTPLIMITNDDGIQAKGIQTLVNVSRRYGEIVVVAPNSSYSAMSHAMTINKPLVTKVDNRFGTNIKAYSVAGTPVDCIKLGYHGLVPRRPNIILSGINHGCNSSSSVHYSGTIGAAREAALLGIRGVAISLDDYDDDADFTNAEGVVGRTVERILNSDFVPNVFYNINIPKGEVVGLKVCRAAIGHWLEQPIKASDPFGSDYYWLDGHYINDEPNATDTDVYWLNKKYATITPCKIDVCDYDLISQLSF